MYPKRDECGIDAEERSALLESLLEAIDVPFVVVGSNLRVLFFSQNAASLFGLSLSDVGLPLELVLPPHSVAYAVQSVETAIDGARTVSVPLEIERGYDYEQRVQVLEAPDGGVSGAVLSYVPVSSGEAATGHLGHLIRLYESLLSRLPDMVARLDSEQRFIYANPAMAAAAQVDVDEMLGRRADELELPETLRRMCGTEVKQTVMTGEPLVETVPLLTDRGDERDLWWRMIPELSTLGSVASVLVVATDITAVTAS